MIYTEKIQGLLETLDGKMRILQNVVNGAQQLSQSDVNVLVTDSRKLIERINELVSINR